MKEEIEDLQDCENKIDALLEEYSCYLTVDKELDGAIILVDSDTNKFTRISHIITKGA